MFMFFSVNMYMLLIYYFAMGCDPSFDAQNIKVDSSSTSLVEDGSE